MYDDRHCFQTVLAKLIKNPRFTLAALENFDVFSISHGIHPKVAYELEDFFAKNGYEFLISAQILKKKRLAEILNKLPLLSEMMDSDKLDLFWERYLTHLDFNDYTPQEPLREAAIFCAYMIDHEILTLIEAEIIQYELAKNETAIAWHNSLIGFDEKQENNAFIHPCYRIEVFSIQISQIIEKLHEGAYDNLDKYMQWSEENILYYFHWEKENMAAISLTEDMAAMIKRYKPAMSITQWQQQACEKLEFTNQYFLELLNKLKHMGFLL